MSICSEMTNCERCMVQAEVVVRPGCMDIQIRLFPIIVCHVMSVDTDTVPCSAGSFCSVTNFDFTSAAKTETSWETVLRFTISGAISVTGNGA